MVSSILDNEPTDWDYGCVFGQACLLEPDRLFLSSVLIPIILTIDWRMVCFSRLICYNREMTNWTFYFIVVDRAPTLLRSSLFHVTKSEGAI